MMISEFLFFTQIVILLGLLVIANVALGDPIESADPNGPVGVRSIKNGVIMH